MFIDERHRAILDTIASTGRISVSDIQKEFNVSVDTARRDLRLLEEKGLLKRTHGGAIPTRQIAFSKPPKTTPKDVTVVKENYMAIALKAISMLENNDVIFITSATLGYFMAQKLPNDICLRVATNSITIAEELRKKDNVSVIFIGGEMDNKGLCYDAFSIEMLSKLRFDKSFITSACISSKFGLSIQKSQAISFYNAVIDSSKKTIGLYPTEKIGFDSVVSICPANRLDILITDWDASEEELRNIEDHGLKIIVVEKEPIASLK